MDEGLDLRITGVEPGDEIAGARPDRPVEAVERISQILRETAAATARATAVVEKALGG